jgi:hypothetical protein
MSRTWCTALVLVAIASESRAGAEEPFVLPVTSVSLSTSSDVSRAQAFEPAPTWVEKSFQFGTTSTQMLAGGYWSGPWGPRSRPYNYLPFSIRQGVMTSSPEEHWWGRGNYECLLDLTGAAITSTYGNWFVGPTFFARANLIEPGSPIIPYAQVGTGGIFNDAYLDQTQHAIGQSFEFYLHLELGLKCFVAPNLSLDMEGGLQHTSNGGMAKRNYGVNCYGGTVGLTYYFPTE